MDPRLIADVQAAEGRRLTAYKDSRGLWTAGYGHLLDQKSDWTNVTFPVAQVNYWFENDLAGALTECITLPEWIWLNTACRQNAVVELVFNMGFAHWLGFRKTRRSIQIQDWVSAHDNLLDSDWADQIGLTRSRRIAGYLLSGVYPTAPPELIA